MNLIEALTLAQRRWLLSDNELIQVYAVLRDAAREDEWGGVFPNMGSTINANIHHHQVEMRERGLLFEPVFF